MNKKNKRALAKFLRWLIAEGKLKKGSRKRRLLKQYRKHMRTKSYESGESGSEKHAYEKWMDSYSSRAGHSSLGNPGV